MPSAPRTGRARIAPAQPQSQSVTFRLPPTLVRRIRMAAQAKRLTRSAFLRRHLESTLPKIPPRTT